MKINSRTVWRKFKALSVSLFVLLCLFFSYLKKKILDIEAYHILLAFIFVLVSVVLCCIIPVENNIEADLKVDQLSFQYAGIDETLLVHVTPIPD